MRVVVTGGAGKLGYYLVPRLASEHEVAISDSIEPEGLYAQHYIGDITDYVAYSVGQSSPC